MDEKIKKDILEELNYCCPNISHNCAICRSCSSVTIKCEKCKLCKNCTDCKSGKCTFCITKKLKG